MLRLIRLCKNSATNSPGKTRTKYVTEDIVTVYTIFFKFKSKIIQSVAGWLNSASS
jgi:hypothetical protein